MSRLDERAVGLATVLLVASSSILALGGCESLDGRNRTRKGNVDFQGKQFIDAAAEYEKALTEVEDPTIHYNLGLAYSKVFKVGAEQDLKVLLDVQGSFACTVIPKVSTVERQVCIKEGDKTFEACDAKNVCPSSFKCEKATLCVLDNATIADMSAQHFQKWLTANPTDAETRALMTQVWLDASLYPKALDYWTGLLGQKPNDPQIMGSLAGINLKAGDWRKSIEWYTKVADVSTDMTAKVGAYQFIGNVAWSKLNSKTLTPPESVELADRGIGALQKAAALQPDNPKPVGLTASIYNFRALAMGASWASGLDRASAAELQHESAVLRDKAKKAQGQAASPASPSGETATANPATTGG
jgi:tetratricopeptide (TPR) repeat protein